MQDPSAADACRATHLRSRCQLALRGKQMAGVSRSTFVMPVRYLLFCRVTPRFSGPVPKIYHFKNASSRAPLQPMVSRGWGFAVDIQKTMYLTQQSVTTLRSDYCGPRCVGRSLHRMASNAGCNLAGSIDFGVRWLGGGWRAIHTQRIPYRTSKRRETSSASGCCCRRGS
jgi:hypothetical protein